IHTCRFSNCAASRRGRRLLEEWLPDWTSSPHFLPGEIIYVYNLADPPRNCKTGLLADCRSGMDMSAQLPSAGIGPERDGVCINPVPSLLALDAAVKIPLGRPLAARGKHVSTSPEESATWTSRPAPRRRKGGFRDVG